MLKTRYVVALNLFDLFTKFYRNSPTKTFKKLESLFMKTPQSKHVYWAIFSYQSPIKIIQESQYVKDKIWIYNAVEITNVIGS